VAQKTLVDEKVLREGADITHQTITCTLTLLIQKHSQSALQGFIKALQAVATVLHETNDVSTHLTLVMEVLTQKLGGWVEKSLQEE
jgi:hypothetical protein